MDPVGRRACRTPPAVRACRHTLYRAGEPIVVTPSTVRPTARKPACRRSRRVPQPPRVSLPPHLPLGLPRARGGRCRAYRRAYRHALCHARVCLQACHHARASCTCHRCSPSLPPQRAYPPVTVGISHGGSVELVRLGDGPRACATVIRGKAMNFI